MITVDGLYYVDGLALLWIMDSYFGQMQRFKVKNFLMMDLFLTNTQLFASQDINRWTGVVWIIVMFLSAVWTLILTAPIHCRGSIGEEVTECYISPKSVLMKKQTLYIFYDLRVSKLSGNCHFWVNYSFKDLEHFKWQTTKLQWTLVIINRTLSSVGMEANIVIFTVIILGVNKPLRNPQSKTSLTISLHKIHGSYLNFNVKKFTGKRGCFIGVADKNHNFKIWGVSLNWHQFERNAQLDRVLSLLLYGWHKSRLSSQWLRVVLRNTRPSLQTGLARADMHVIFLSLKLIYHCSSGAANV